MHSHTVFPQAEAERLLRQKGLGRNLDARPAAAQSEQGRCGLPKRRQLAGYTAVCAGTERKERGRSEEGRAHD